VFGLVSPYTEHKSEGRRLKASESSSNAIESDDIEYYYNQVKGLKVLKNFGSKVKSVEEKRGTGIEAAVSGFNINFEAGDPCLYNPNLFYTSEIQYICSDNDMKDSQEHVNWPVLVQPRQACHLVFRWFSRDACE